MEFDHFSASENLEKDLFKKSFEIVERHRKKRRFMLQGAGRCVASPAAGKDLQTTNFILGLRQVVPEGVGGPRWGRRG
jgi:hypothetical protein